jgi:hypothetical protein
MSDFLGINDSLYPPPLILSKLLLVLVEISTGCAASRVVIGDGERGGERTGEGHA